MADNIMILPKIDHEFHKELIDNSGLQGNVYRYRHPELKTGKKRGRPKETNLTKEDWKERYEIVKKYQAFLKAQREKK